MTSINKANGAAAAGKTKLPATLERELKDTFKQVQSHASFTDKKPDVNFVGDGFVVQAPPHLMIGGSTFVAHLVGKPGSDPSKAAEVVFERKGTMFPPDAWAGPFSIEGEKAHGGLTAAHFKALKSQVEDLMASGKIKDSQWSPRLPGVDLGYARVEISHPPKGNMGGSTVTAWIPTGPVGMKGNVNDAGEFFIGKTLDAPPGQVFAGPFDVKE